MKEAKITHKITQGVYILTVGDGGCVVDAVMRAGSQDGQDLVAVAVAKVNHSHDLLAQNQRYALSVLAQDADMQLIQTFGYKSARDTDKFADVKVTKIEGAKVLDDALGYMVFEKIDAVENETHTIYIGKMIAGKITQDNATSMTYVDYQARKSELIKEKDDLKKAETTQGKTAWVCTVCGYVYYGDEVPDDYICPLCGLGKSYFKKKD